MDTLQIYGYKITTDPDFRDKENAMTPELKARMEELYMLAESGNRSDIKTYLDLIEKYPENPQIKNYLTILYKNLNDWKKFTETNHWIVKEHPDYLFGLLNLASEYIDKKEYSKVPEILGENLEIKDLYPERDTFHLAEVTGYYKMVIHYFTSINDHENAEQRFEILSNIAPEHPDTGQAQAMLFKGRMINGLERYKEEEKTRIKVETKLNKDIVQTIEPPIFNHPEIENLYHIGLYISKEELDVIYNLPRESLISDLEKILNDLLVRYEYYQEKQKNDGWTEEEWSFAIHAIYILGDLKAKKSLPMVLKILSQTEDFLDFWFGDFLTSNLWEPLLKLGLDELGICKQFMCTPGIYTYSKSEVAEMGAQIALHFPERRNEIIAWFKDIFIQFLESSPDDNLIDSDLIGLLICNAIDIQGIVLLPEIEDFYQLGYVATGICGSLESVKKDIGRPKEYSPKKAIMSVKARYEEITSTWYGYNKEQEGYTSTEPLNNYQTIVNNSPKVGRNDPCPCGSGKKYKKCCLNKT